MTSKRTNAALVAVAAIVGITFLFSGATYAQDKGNSPDKDAQLRVIQLKHASAMEAATVLSQLLGEKSARVVADPRSNSLIVSGTGAEFDVVKNLLQYLDAEPKEKEVESPQVSVIDLKYIPADKNLESTLKTVLGTARSKVAVAMDPTRNAILFSGNEHALKTLKVLLDSLDRPVAKEQPAREMQVRVVWLASASGGKVDKDIPKPPDDLKEVVAELDKLGVREPFLVSQALVNVSTTGTFDIHGTAQLGPTPCTFTVTGQIVDKPSESPTLQISIDAVSQAPRIERNIGGVAPMCRVQTQISAPPGHPVVLGVTPTGILTSVFVIQLLPKRATGERKQ